VRLKLKIIDRYFAAEMLGPFIVGTVGFIMVMITDLLFTYTDLIINKGIPLFAVLQLMLYRLPSILIMTFPVATLFATAMAMGRLSVDNEINAFRTSGNNLWRIGAPIMVIALLVSMISFFTNEKIVPRANQKSEDIIRRIIMKSPLPQIQENVFFKDSYGRTYFVKRFDSKTGELDNIMIYELGNEALPRVITANKAQYNKLVWTLKDGVIHKFDDKKMLQYQATFTEMEINVHEDILTYLSSYQKTTQEMNTRELGLMIKNMKKSGVDTDALRVDYFMKFSIPFTCFVFALLGLPLSLPSSRSGGRTWGVVFVIVIMFTFYVFASVFRSLGRGGVMDPMLAAWFPQVLFGFAGVAMLIKEAKK
jgi:lipopolysaccharide export system permease protein